MLTDFADRRTPRAIRNALAEYAGYNRFGGANWRCIVAEDHLVLRGGVHKTMPSGDVKTFELERLPNGTYLQHFREVKPEKVEHGFKQVPKWGVSGWILERWFAPETLNRTIWENEKGEDGTPLMGPYPEKGYYFMLAGPWEHMPELTDLRQAIAMHLRMEEERPLGYEAMLKQTVDEDQAAEEAAYQKAQADLAYFYESEVEPVMKGTSLAAGRIRNEIAAGMGDHSHQGIA
jgi:hypothetical protein